MSEGSKYLVAQVKRLQAFGDESMLVMAGQHVQTVADYMEAMATGEAEAADEFGEAEAADEFGEAEPAGTDDEFGEAQGDDFGEAEATDEFAETEQPVEEVAEATTPDWATAGYREVRDYIKDTYQVSIDKLTEKWKADPKARKANAAKIGERVEADWYAFAGMGGKALMGLCSQKKLTVAAANDTSLSNEDRKNAMAYALVAAGVRPPKA